MPDLYFKIFSIFIPGTSDFNGKIKLQDINKKYGYENFKKYYSFFIPVGNFFAR